MVDLNMKVVEPRKLTPESRFKFRCHPGISCFTECCGKTTIILTPYDILRLKNRLNMKARGPGETPRPPGRGGAGPPAGPGSGEACSPPG